MLTPAFDWTNRASSPPARSSGRVRTESRRCAAKAKATAGLRRSAKHVQVSQESVHRLGAGAARGAVPVRLRGCGAPGRRARAGGRDGGTLRTCLLYTSDAADEEDSV